MRHGASEGSKCWGWHAKCQSILVLQLLQLVQQFCLQRWVSLSQIKCLEQARLCVLHVSTHEGCHVYR